MLLQSMSLDPCDYGWRTEVHAFEPVPTLDPMAPDELLWFTSCNCKGDCSNRRCGCKKNSVYCIAACGNCKGIACRNSFHSDVETGEEDLDLKTYNIYFRENEGHKEHEKWVWLFQPHGVVLMQTYA